MYPGVLYFFSFLRRVYNNLLTDHLAKCEHIERVPQNFIFILKMQNIYKNWKYFKKPQNIFFR